MVEYKHAIIFRPNGEQISFYLNDGDVKRIVIADNDDLLIEFNSGDIRRFHGIGYAVLR